MVPTTATGPIETMAVVQAVEAGHRYASDVAGRGEQSAEACSFASVGTHLVERRGTLSLPVAGCMNAAGGVAESTVPDYTV